MIKPEKLKQLLRKILDEQDHDDLTLGSVKRLLEAEIGLEDGNLDSQTAEIKDLLSELLNEDNNDNKEESGNQQSAIIKKEKARKNTNKSEKQEEEEEQQEKPKKQRKWDNEDGETVFELDPSTHVTVKKFKGTPYVDIRKFYQKDGKWFPSPKGISLKVTEWKALKNHSNQVDAMLGNK